MSRAADDIEDLQDRVRSGISRLRGLEIWQLLFEDVGRNHEPARREPTGKIRLVTSRWVDRPSRSQSRRRERRSGRSGDSIF